MKRVLVTGGGGFIGAKLVTALRARGIETTLVGRQSHYPTATAQGAICCQGDIRDLDFMRQVTREHDTVFHVAAKAGVWGSRESYYSSNLVGTQNVITACQENGVKRLVYTSTPSVVFNGQSICDGDESLPYASNPLCHYAASKIEAERVVLAANQETLLTTSLRPHLVWGPGDNNLIPRLIARGRAGQLRVVGQGYNRVDISYIDNVVLAHLLAADNLLDAQSAAGEAFFISQGKPVELWPWINGLFSRLEIPMVTRQISETTAYRLGWGLEKVYGLFGVEAEPRMTRFVAEQLAKSHWFSIDKARKLLNYKPVCSTEEGMKRLVATLQRTNQSTKKR